MTSEASPEICAPKNRVSLDSDSLGKIDRIVAEVNSKLKGVHVKRSDLVNLIIKAHGDNLSSKELKFVVKEFFDEVAFMSWAIQEAKDSKSQGQPRSMVDLLKERPHGALSASAARPKGDSKPKSKIKTAPTLIEKSDANSSKS